MLLRAPSPYDETPRATAADRSMSRTSRTRGWESAGIARSRRHAPGTPRLMACWSASFGVPDRPTDPFDAKAVAAKNENPHFRTISLFQRARRDSNSRPASNVASGDFAQLRRPYAMSPSVRRAGVAPRFTGEVRTAPVVSART